MKTLIYSVGLLTLGAVSLSLIATTVTAADPQSVTVLDRGPHHQTIQAVSTVQDETGALVTVTNSYVQIESGGWFQDPEGNWQEAVPQFEVFPGGAIARRTQHQIILPNNPNAEDVDVLMPGGQRLTSRVIGLSLFNAANGESVFIADLQDCQGKLIPPGNEVIYENCFAGEGVRADLRFSLEKASYSQDIILREKLGVGPADWNFDPATSFLEVVTAFTSAPEPHLEARVLKATSDPAVAPDFVDNVISFSTMQLSTGQAFSLADQDTGLPGEPAIAVGKRWMKTDTGLVLLFESVAWSDLEPLLANLPEKQAKAGGGAAKKAVASVTRVLPPRRLANKTSTNTVLIAQAPVRGKGVVLDYTTINSSFTNYTLRGDMVYHITGPCYFYQTTKLEAAVLKFANSASAQIFIKGPLDCQTSPYRPAVFTSFSDNTVGETISGSTGTPASYGGYALFLDGYTSGVAYNVHDIRVAYANTGIYFSGPYPHQLSHAQLLKCQTAVMPYYCGLSVRNVLINDVTTAFNLPNSTTSCEHLTVNVASQLSYVPSGTSTLYLTNSLIVQATNTGYYSGMNNYFLSSGAGVFQTVGAGGHYLANDAYRNAGTLNVNAALLADLKKKTTYPPRLLTNDFTATTTLAPQAGRDTDTPDIGFHSDVLDYLFTSLNLTNANTRLVLTNGVAVGIYGIDGLTLRPGTTLISEGMPLNLNRLVRYHAVQEQWNTFSTASTMNLLKVGSSTTPLPVVRLRFTDVSLLADNAGKKHLLNLNNAAVSALTLQDTQLRGAHLYLSPSVSGMTTALTNNLFERANVVFYNDPSPQTLSGYNNLFWYGSAQFTYTSSNTTWTVKDNLFDGVTLSSPGAYNFTHSYNGYSTGVTILSGSTSTNKTGLVADYVAGPLGRYYYPATGTSTSLTNLLNTGSRNATNAGLYHFTIQTSQAKEANSTVDIGMHYVALNGQNLPVDTDNDGAPDYYEDKSGDGSWQSNETVMTDVDTDYDGRSDGQEWADGTDPINAGSFRRTRLGYWRFNTTDLKGEKGELPIQSANIQNPPGYDGNAVQITNTAAILKYGDLEANGAANINCRYGSIRLLFRPFWQSLEDNFPMGTGHWMRLFQIGNTGGGTGGGLFRLSIDPGGTNVVFESVAGASTFACTAGIVFVTNQWTELLLTYSPSNVVIWQDNGVVLNTNVSNLPVPPGNNVRSLGFSIGSNTNATEQVYGLIDEFETYNFQLLPSATNSWTLSVTNTVSPPGIKLYWQCPTNYFSIIKRKLPSDANWTFFAGADGTNYIDTNIVVGQRYEYEVSVKSDFRANYFGEAPKVDLANYALAAINGTHIETRGKVILLVDNTLTNALANDLNLLKTNLVGDGWSVVRLDVARHNDTTWSANPSNIVSIKSQILSNYDSSVTNIVFIIGHVAIPYSGMKANDGHVGQYDTNGVYLGDHRGAWVADGYYGTTNSAAWTDSSVTQTNLDFPPPSDNVPGDGAFDNDFFPSNVQLAVGRVDFAKLPVFGTDPNREAQLLSQYLQKDHRYRNKQTTFQDRLIYGSFFPEPYNAQQNRMLYGNALRAGSRLFPLGSAALSTGDFFFETNTFIWGFLGGFGTPIAIQGLGLQYHTSLDLTDPAKEPKGAFYYIDGSWFADWNLSENNFSRSLLATATNGLAVIANSEIFDPYYFYPPPLHLEPLGLGEPLGASMLRTYNQPLPDARRWMTILGDPTLRAQVTSPPSNLDGNNGTNVTLTWTASPDTGAQYAIYRSVNNLNGPWSKLGTTSNTSYPDNPAPAGAKLYQVRALKLVLTASGSYTNQSQGIFKSLN